MDAIIELLNMALLFFIPAILLFIPVYGLCKQAPVYKVFVEGRRKVLILR